MLRPLGVRPPLANGASTPLPDPVAPAAIRTMSSTSDPTHAPPLPGDTAEPRSSTAIGHDGERVRILVVILNYGTANLVEQCLESLEPELVGGPDRVVIVDNASPDDSADQIAATIDDRGWDGWAELVRAETNAGFSAGNNVGAAVHDSDWILFLNSDTIVRPGAIAALMASAQEHPRAGLIGPRLEWEDERPQVSAFRAPTPISEGLRGASLGVLDRVLHRWVVRTDITSEPIPVDWVSFAGVLVRRAAWTETGPMDDGFFMYFEDIDYALRIRSAGWEVWHAPSARIVHLRGGTASVKKDAAARRRVPPYFYAARSRYFAKHFGRLGLLTANLLWAAGSGLGVVLQVVGRKRSPTKSEWRDVWHGFPSPMTPAPIPARTTW